MYETETLPIKAVELYANLLGLFPGAYQKRFGQEMEILFLDLYMEELEKNGKIGVGFWLSIFADTTKSAVREHINMIKKQGFKNYFHINKYNIAGGILLLPFAVMLGIDFFSRLAQGDFSHYNRATNAFMSQTFLYQNYFGKPYLLMFIVIWAPILAVLINLIPFFKSLRMSKSWIGLVLTNLLTLALIAFGLFALLIIFGHDVIPCTVKGVIDHGLGSFGEAVSICKNA